MRKSNGFSLAVILLFLVPGCKPETPPAQLKEVPAEAKGSSVVVRSGAVPSAGETTSAQPEKPPAEGKEGLAEKPGSVEPSAREAAVRFLKALKNIDTAEGKKTLAETRWRQTMKFPACQEFNVVSEEMFSTDIPGVKGYRQEVMLAVPREGRKPYAKRYTLIAYRDTKHKAWKVFDFSETWDVEQEIEKACAEKSLAEGEATARQGRLMHCSYWLMMAGRVEQAGEKAKKVNELHARQSDPDDEAKYYKKRADATIEMIARMSGARL